MQFALVNTDDTRRPQVERLVGEAFRARHSAEVDHLPRRMAALFGNDGEPLAAIGLRLAADGFFSECYLDRPAEQTIAAAVGAPVGRGHVVEFTALAGREPRLLLPLLRGAVRLADAEGGRWLMFTAIRRLRHGIRHAGFDLLDLAAADRRRVSRPDAWGDYYRCGPRVCVVAAAPVLARLAPAHLTPVAGLVRQPRELRA